MNLTTIKKKLEELISDEKGFFQKGKFTPIKGLQQGLQSWAEKNPQLAQKITSIPTEEVPYMGKTFTMPKIPLVSQYVKYIGAPQAEALQKGIMSAPKFFQPQIYGKPTITDVGNIAGGLGAINPLSPIIGGGIGATIKGLENILTKKPLSQDLYEGYRSGFEFQAKLGPLSRLTGTVLSPLLKKINPAGAQSINTYINLAKNATTPQMRDKFINLAYQTFLKQAGENAIKGAVSMGAYGALREAKDWKERAKNIFSDAVMGAVFETGTKTVLQSPSLAKLKFKIGFPKLEGQPLKTTIPLPEAKIVPPKTTTPPLSPTAQTISRGEAGKIKIEGLTEPQTTQKPKGDYFTPLKEEMFSTLPKEETINDKELIKRLTLAIKEAKPIRDKQEELYSKARSQKLAKLMKAREKMAGEKGFYEELAALKGELPKVQYESIRKEFNQQNVDRLFNMIKESKALDEWGKINAQVGLQKILGKEGGGVPTKSEIEKLYKVFGEEFTEAILSKRPFFEKLTEAGMQLYNLPRSMMAGVFDFSATLMQNLLFAYRHPIMTAKNLAKQIKMFASNEYYKASMEEIYNRPNAELYKKAKLALTDVGPIVTGREEQFMASWAEKIPGLGRLIRATGRAYTGFLNRMRADVFDQLVETQKSLGLDVNDAKFLKDAGEFVNMGTGRGSLGKLERIAPILAQGFFSARKLVAAFKFLDPRLYITSSPAVRQEALKTALSFIGGGMTILAIADNIPGVEVGKDPTSTDFGKIKIGNTRFNVFGTYQQIVVLLVRLYKGYATSSTTGKRMVLGDETAWRPLNRLDLITKFFESKEHPTLSLIIGALRGQTNLGQPFDLPSETLNRLIPMVLSDSYDLYKEHGSVGLLGLIPMILGVPTQTYGREYATQEFTPSGKPKIRLKPETDLSKDIILKITGKEKSNIPEDQQKFIVPRLQKERQEKIEKEQLKRDLQSGKIPIKQAEENQDIEIQKLLFEYSPEKTKVVGDVFLYKDDKGKVKDISLDFTVEEPQLTGKAELDKKMISKYKSNLTKKANDIVELYELGYLDKDTAEELLNELKTKYNKFSVKKIKLSPPPKIKIRLSPRKKVKIVMPKNEFPLVKINYQTKTKPTKISNISKILAEKIRQAGRI